MDEEKIEIRAGKLRLEIPRTAEEIDIAMSILARMKPKEVTPPRDMEIERDHYRKAFKEQVQRTQELEKKLQECQFELERLKKRRDVKRRV
ncbi:unnamed protein product [marine sediment metagenome]|uniref:Uncharacterized protein n=1 Tax=marine sediment metagenome TaxID=412755 RepID=X1P4H2_9ZZZZ